MMKREQLIREVAALRRAGEIRAYVAAVRKEAESGAGPSEELLAWEAWAMGVVAEIDPVGVRVQTSAE